MICGNTLFSYRVLAPVVEEYGLKTVQEYMEHIRANAEMAVRNLLRRIAKELGTELSAIDYLDDGTPVRIIYYQSLRPFTLISQISLKVSIDESKGSAVFDFEGTGPEVRGNLNAPISVVHSSIIYCLRSMLDMDIPLNAGCLVPLTSMFHNECTPCYRLIVPAVKIPEDSLLSPSDTAAVCAGNVLTSQRIVDVVLKAFDACAASQGCTK